MKTLCGMGSSFLKLHIITNHTILECFVGVGVGIGIGVGIWKAQTCIVVIGSDFKRSDPDSDSDPDVFSYSGLALISSSSSSKSVPRKYFGGVRSSPRCLASQPALTLSGVAGRA